MMIPSVWALDVQDVRFGLHTDTTRVVIELNEAPTYRAFMLPAEANKPYRLVIDMPDFEWKAGIIPEQPKTTVTDVRSGSLRPDVMRLVIDLSKPALIKEAFLLPAQSGKPNRLVIDFKTVSPIQFSQSQQEIFGDFDPGDIETAPQSEFGAFIERFFTDDNKEVQIRNGMVIPPRKPAVAPPMASNSTATPRKLDSPVYKPLIVIDAGHGGADPGALGTARLREKNITLAAAKMLKTQLEATGRYRAALTRSDDTYLKLYKRVSIARAKKADLFILSSLYEGLPNVLLEALALNKFIISSNCPTGPSEILDNNKGGLLFKISDYEDLAKKILFFRSNKFDCLKKIKHAKKRLHRFDYNKNLEKYLIFLKTELN